jgi:hypothetical protein
VHKENALDVVAEVVGSEIGQSLIGNSPFSRELEGMATIFDKINDLRKRMPGHDDAELIDEFRVNLNDLMEGIKQKVGKSTDPTVKD